MASLLNQKGLELFCQISTARELPYLRSSNAGTSKISCGQRFSTIRRRTPGGRVGSRETGKLLRFALSRKYEQKASVLEQEHELSLVEEFQRSCATPVESLRAVVDAMVAEFVAGLAAESGTDLKMLPAYLESLPNGEEKGCFYALDLGGTNFRVLRAELGGKEGRLLKQEFKVYTIPHELMVGESDDLFDFIAGKLGDFVALEEEIHHDRDRKRELGFTFSFPVQQHSIASGTLIHWSKGFTVSGTVGKDVVVVLREAIRRKGLDLEVAALVNDTVGTLAGGRYWSDDVMVAVILGTGTNACYVESAAAVPKWKGAQPACGEHVINTEWGNFNCSSLPTTFADEELDRESVNPGEHIFEKMMSGMYLGEIVRRVILRLAQEGVLFADQTSGLSKKLTLTTPDVSKIHADESSTLEVAGEFLSRGWGITSSTVEERQILLSVIETVTKRGARLAAAAIVAVLKKIGRIGDSSNGNLKARQTIVAMDGGLYEHYSEFRGYMLEAIDELLGKDGASNIAIKLSKDGSGIGAVLLAACHSKYRSTH